MAINVTNTNGSTSTIVINNSNGNTLNVSNQGVVKSHVEVNGGADNAITINNLPAVDDGTGFLTFLGLSLTIVGAGIYFLAKRNRENEQNTIEEITETVVNEFEERKKELEYIISTKIKSDNLKDRIKGVIESLEGEYNKNIDIIANLKFKEGTINSLKEKNSLILSKLDEMINKIDIDDSKLEVNDLDEIIRYIDVTNEAKANQTKKAVDALN